MTGQTWPYYSESEVEIVSRILREGRVNRFQGVENASFESEFANKVGILGAVAVANGTVALEGCLRAIGISPGDEVIVTPRSFLASASVVSWLGATPVFADVDLNTQCLDVESVAKCVSAATKAVIVVHFAGNPANILALRELCDAHNLKLIEDCAQAHGARWNDQSVGSFGDFAAWSFCTDKIISTGGEGGMIGANLPETLDYLISLKDHGKNFAKLLKPSTSFPFPHDYLGTNWRMTEMQAAIGRIQLGKLDEMVMRRRENLKVAHDTLSSCPGLRVPTLPLGAYSSAYKGYVFVDCGNLKSSWSRSRIVNEMRELGFDIQPGACSEIYREYCFKHKRLPVPCANAKKLGEESLCFLVDHMKSLELVEQMAQSMKTIVNEAVR